MKEVITSLSLISIMTMVMEVVLSDSELKKSVRFALGILTALVIVLPLSNLVNSFKGGRFDYDGFLIDKSISQSVVEQKFDVMEKACEEKLKEMGVEADVIAYTHGEEVLIITVKVNKGDKAGVEEIVSTVFNVEQNKVSVYG